MKTLTKILTLLLTLALTLSLLPQQTILAQENTTIWCLNYHLKWFQPGNQHFNQPGLPPGSVTVLEENNTRHLHITNLANETQGVDMRFRPDANHMRPGDIVTLTGQVENPAAASNILLRRQPGNVEIGSFTIEDNGTFNITYTLANDDDFLDAIRVTTSESEDFYLHSFQIKRDSTSPNWDLTEPSLANLFNQHFLMGNIWSCPMQMSDPTTIGKFLHHYNTITASNFHKPSFLLSDTPNDWNFDFNAADTIVDWAEDNDVAMVFHTLIWHSQSRPWLTNVEHTTEPLTRAEAIENMHRYISTVASRYSGRIYSWDVVNEAITPEGTWGANPDWRFHIRRTGQGLDPNQHHLSRWYDAFANGAGEGECGSDYIYYAFRFARIYDPYAILYYNDYNEHVPVKREAIAQMIEEINERWTHDPLYDGRLLIEGMGMQSHHSIRGWMSDPNYVDAAIQRYAQTGVRISITEMNVYIAGGGIEPTPEELPDFFAEQARRYTRLFMIYMQHSDYIERVTSFIWVDFPRPGWTNRLDHPALFDLQRQAKPAFESVANLPTRIGYPGTDGMESNMTIPTITTGNIINANTNERFSTQFAATQNTFDHISWNIIDGNLPNGLRLVSATGVIMGTPTEEGIFSFTVSASNAKGGHARHFHLAVGDVSEEEISNLETNADFLIEPIMIVNEADNAEEPIQEIVAETPLGNDDTENNYVEDINEETEIINEGNGSFRFTGLIIGAIILIIALFFFIKRK